VTGATGRDGIAVLGGGGHAKVVIAALVAAGERIGGVFDDDSRLRGISVLGYEVEGPLARGAELGLRRAVLAIGDNGTRRRLAAALDHEWVTVVHPRAWVDPSAGLSEGAMIMAGAILQPDAEIGRHAIVNTGASIDHDCRIGDFVHIAPGARLAGGVVVGERSLLGIGCAVIPGIEIGAGAVVAAGAVVVESVAAGAKVGGVPARPIISRLQEP
jgi:sugar O-acyltransferase (sialic acid O-acetyltransferase NeuD family)